MLAPDFTFSHQRLPGLDLEQFAPFFRQLAPDQHVDGNYRFRRYSRFTGVPGHLRKLGHEAFVQSKQENYLSGNIARDFDELEQPLICLPPFEQLIQTVNLFFGYDPARTVLGIHQIRITCSEGEAGLPVPEGIHQDGFDLIAMCCAARHNVSGAETRLYRTPEEKPVYNCVLEPGDIIYCNDRSLFHYTSPIKPAPGHFRGYRDMFVLTVSLGEQQWKTTSESSTSRLSDNSFPPLPV